MILRPHKGNYYEPAVSTFKKNGILKRFQNNQKLVILRPHKGNVLY